MRTAPKLKARYNHYNKRYFNGRLPDGVTVGWSDSLWRTGVLGQVDGYSDGSFEIRIARELARFPVVSELVLLHETTHVALYERGHYRGGHGNKFQREMLRLARAGALRFLW